MQFGNIKHINLNALSSWQDKIFLTFDIDWCSDKVLLYTLNFIEKYNLKATFFVTHETNILERMRDNENIELGIHPNFNPLLSGDFIYGKNIDEVVSYYKKIVPEAVSVRSHSMTQNSLILDSFEKFGLTYDVNTFIPFSSEIVSKPYKHWTNELIKVPYFWEDDVHCNYKWDWNVDNLLNYSGIKVFDFHPIHIFLNTKNIETYDNARKHFDNMTILEKIKNKNEFGSEVFLKKIINNKGLR